MIQDSIDSPFRIVGAIYDIMIAERNIIYDCDETTVILLGLNEINYKRCVIIAVSNYKLLYCLWKLLFVYEYNDNFIFMIQNEKKLQSIYISLLRDGDLLKRKDTFAKDNVPINKNNNGDHKSIINVIEEKYMRRDTKERIRYHGKSFLVLGSKVNKPTNKKIEKFIFYAYLITIDTVSYTHLTLPTSNGV